MKPDSEDRNEIHLPREFNFAIQLSGKVSALFLAHGIHTFSEAMGYVRALPYGRNENKDDLTTVFADSRGTCSTKHALLYLLATENGVTDIKLQLGIMKMNARTMPEVTAILSRYHLDYVPEAHNYLRLGHHTIDCTKRNSRPSDFINDLLAEIEIMPSQITTFKVDYHKRFLQDWLQDNPQVPYDLNDFWAIREECIQAIADHQPI